MLKMLGYSSPSYFIELYDYQDGGDFLFPHRLLAWVITESADVFNMENVEPLKQKNKKLQALKTRFPQKQLLYNHRAKLPTGGIDDPNYIPDFNPADFLLRKETGINRDKLAYAKAEASRMRARRKDQEIEEVRLWVGNPLHTLTSQFDCINVLDKVRNMNGTPDKFPYLLTSYGDFLKLAQNGNVNLLMNPLDQSICWYIAAAKDSLFEGIFEWLEAVQLLVSPDSLEPEEQKFFKQTSTHIPSVVHGYNHLNKYLKQLCATKDFRKLNTYKKTSIMLDLIQNFPLKKSGKTHFSRLTKLPPREVPSEFPDIFRKAFSFQNQQNKSRFQPQTTTNSSQKGKYIDTKQAQQYKDLLSASQNRKRKRNEERKKTKKKHRGAGPPKEKE